MTPTNAARDALEDIKRECYSAEEELQRGLVDCDKFAAIETILTALSSVDFAALGAALNSLDKEKAKALYPEVAFACIDPVDFVALEKAARLVLSLGKDQKIDPLAATPDGLVSE